MAMSRGGVHLVSFFLVLLSLGCCIAWIVFKTAQDTNSSTPVGQRLCQYLCGDEFIYDRSSQCCSLFTCKSKQICKQELDSEYGDYKLVFMSVGATAFVTAVLLCCCNRQSSDISYRRFDSDYESQSRQNQADVYPPRDHSIQDRLPQLLIYKERRIGCGLCLEPFYGGESYRQLECRHTFHSRCIREWMQREMESNCPFCGQRV